MALFVEKHSSLLSMIGVFVALALAGQSAIAQGDYMAPEPPQQLCFVYDPAAYPWVPFVKGHSQTERVYTSPQLSPQNLKTCYRWTSVTAIPKAPSVLVEQPNPIAPCNPQGINNCTELSKNTLEISTNTNLGSNYYIYLNKTATMNDAWISLGFPGANNAQVDISPAQCFAKGPKLKPSDAKDQTFVPGAELLRTCTVTFRSRFPNR